MARDSEKSRELILESAERFIKKRGTTRLTVDAIAKEAGCAKGLVHYHFKTKTGVVKGAAERLTESRKRRWNKAFEAATPVEAVDRTWKVLTDESADGTLRAWFSLVGSEVALTDSTVKNMDASFSEAVRRAALQMLGRSGLVPSVPDAEMGWYMGSVIHGMGVHLVCGGDPRELEGAYMAAWAAMLSLTRPGTLSAAGGADGEGASETAGSRATGRGRQAKTR